MSTISLEVEVPQVSCQKVGCTEDPANMIAVSVYRKPDGSMACNDARLPEGWIRMVEMQEDGRESPFKVYCPACAAGL